MEKLSAARGASARPSDAHSTQVSDMPQNVPNAPLKKVTITLARKRQKTEEVVSQELLDDRDSSFSFTEMPLDVLLEILGYLDPISLLYLSHSSSSLRNALMSSFAKKIWAKSYAETKHGLPPMPEDMSIPQFVALAVDNFCDFCLVSFPKEALIIRIWAARLRCCRECMYDSKHILVETHMSGRALADDFYCYFERERIHELLPGFSENDSEYSRRRFPRAIVEDLGAEYHRDNDGKTDQEKRAWLERKMDEGKEIRKHAKLCKNWEKQQAEMAERMREERREEILALLRQAGYAEEVKDWGEWQSFRMHTFVNRAQPLMKKEWRTEGGALIALAEQTRVKRLEKARRSIFKTRYRTVEQVYKNYLRGKSAEEQTLLPGIGDVVTFEEVKRLIEGAPVERKITANVVRTLITELEKTRFPAWRASCEAALVNLLNANATRARSDLDLATSVFVDKDSGCTLWYPELLNHRGSLANLELDDPQALVRQRAWSAGQLCVEVDLVRKAERLVKLAGLDPKMATPEDMDERDAWFTRAGDIVKQKEGLCLMMWREAMDDDEEDLDALVLVSDEDTSLAREMRADWGSDNLSGWLKVPASMLTKTAEKQRRRGVA
ncbi:uncharacterized protein SCHCODRAFT_02559889 [Schizophyllum commune H4-8]|nr:uncharacterized protein SCHCODRAFT_02559889 [Schizophyllum commune H4-8]KAI5900854.1 hypothetical protein SCHCODRAFT_02559889 [Schizophyllum commune H4-8]